MVGLVETVLPAVAVAVETREDFPNAELFPVEERALGQAVERRRREFITGRECARKALARLGLPPTPIGSGRHGEPLWPPGIVGSITHCAGYRACAAAWATDLRSIGIDAEPDLPLPPGVWETIAHGAERHLPSSGVGVGGPHLDRLLFSIKESFYKAWFPATKQTLGFEDVELSINLAARTFRARLRWEPVDCELPFVPDLDGRWAAGGGIIVSAVAIAAESG